MNYYACLLYPEKYVEFENICEELKLTMYADTICGICISPVHSADNNDCVEHRHVILQSVKPLTKKQKNFLCQTFRGCFDVNDLGAMIDYLTHKNQPEKEQFPPEVVPEVFGNFDCQDSCEILADLIFMSKHFDEISEFTDYLVSQGYLKELEIVSRKCYFFQSLFMSRRKTQKNEKNS